MCLIAAEFTPDVCSVSCESVHVQMYTHNIQYPFESIPSPVVRMSREYGSVCMREEEGREVRVLVLTIKETKQHASVVKTTITKPRVGTFCN